jgi:hypothetical protein
VLDDLDDDVDGAAVLGLAVNNLHVLDPKKSFPVSMFRQRMNRFIFVFYFLLTLSINNLHVLDPKKRSPFQCLARK